MKTTILILISTLAAASLALAAPITLTITPDADQQAGLDYAVAQANAAIDTANAARPEGDPAAPPLTAQQYIAARLTELLTSYGRQRSEEVGAELLKRALDLPKAERDALIQQVSAALPSPSPSPTP